ncbi:MAG TPA: hypothetical protein IAC82_09160 [Candidatus Merdivicinus intestinigallinarum]|nr:hypothetical protein [Candidatus Merdivicinus intestinigallinarum]
MNCQYYDSDFETCKNGDCPYCADFCPVTENQEVCRYSDLDETEIAHRESLDHEKQDSQEALQALAQENQELKKQLADIEKILGDYGLDHLQELVETDRKKGKPVWVVERDEIGEPCGISGNVLVALVDGVALVLPYINGCGELDALLQDCLENTAEDMECYFGAFPVEDCYLNKELAQKALKARGDNG